MHLQKPLAVSIRRILVNVIISFQVFNLKASHNSSVSELPGVFEETPFHHMLEFWPEVRSTANQARDGNNYTYAGTGNVREKHRKSQHSCLSNELPRFVHLLRFPHSRCPLQEFFWGTADSHRCLSASCNVETEVFENKTTLQSNIDILLMKGKFVESTCLIICFAWLRLLNSNII